MPQLIDIAPVFETAEIRGHTVTIRGVGLGTIGALLFRFPEIRIMLGKGEINAPALASLSGDALAAVIAGAVEELDEANAKNLTLDEQVALLQPILKVTMPRGPGPFVESLLALVQGAGGAAPQTAPATT